MIGDPTDGALLVAALKSNVNVQNALDEKPIVHVLPFSFERKRMSTVHKLNGDFYIYTKGAPRNILDICNKVLVDGKVEELNEENMMIIESRIHEFANQGLRVIAVAYKEIPKSTIQQRRSRKRPNFCRFGCNA